MLKCELQRLLVNWISCDAQNANTLYIHDRMKSKRKNIYIYLHNVQFRFCYVQDLTYFACISLQCPLARVQVNNTMAMAAKNASTDNSPENRTMHSKSEQSHNNILWALCQITNCFTEQLSMKSLKGTFDHPQSC